MSLPTAVAAAEDLRRAHRELLAVVDGLADGDWSRLVPYGDWSVQDLVAHVIGDMSPSGPGLILAGVLTPQFIADTSTTFDVRTRNQAMVEQRRALSREDLRQMLFECHDAMIAAMLKLDQSHLPVLRYTVPIGPDYDLRVEDWLWHGYHDRQHADDIRRALEVEHRPQPLTFAPEVEAKIRGVVRSQEGLLRAVYSVAEDAWPEQSRDCPGWSYHDILAHVASNETRLQTRLRSALGEAKEGDLAAINDVDAWNRDAVEQRRGWTARRLIDELIAGRHQTMAVLAQFSSAQLSGSVRLAGGQTVAVLEFIDRLSAHTARHGGQLVPASRARPFAP